MTKTLVNFGKHVMPMPLLREKIGDVLHDHRTRQRKTLRQVATQSNVSLSYLSEVERGYKEVSSEVLASIANALDVPMSQILTEVGERFSVYEEYKI